MPLGGREMTFGDDLIRFFADADVVVCNFEGVSVPGGRSVVMQQVHGPETIRAFFRMAPADRMDMAFFVITASILSPWDSELWVAWSSL